MKTKTILRLLSLLCLFFASCNDEQAYPPGGGQVPAVFTSGFAGAGAPAVGSRAANAAWTAGDAVGIYMIDSENYALASAWKKNRKYTVGNLSTGELTPDGTENIMYYPPNATVRFVAYSPYSGEATAAGQATYSLTDQSTQAKKEAADFVFYRGTTDRSDTDPAETLTFKHRFSKINITVRRDADAPSCAGLVVALTGMPAAVTVDLSAMAADATQTGTTGMSTGTTSAAITPWISASTAASATAEAIVAPHAGTGSFTGRTLTFTAGDDTFTYPLPNGLTFEPGKVYTFDFSLTKVAVLLNQSVITNWNAGDIEQTDDITFGANSALHTVGYDATSSQLTLVTEASTAVPMVTRSTSATDRLAGAPAWLTAATFGAPATADGMTRRVLTVTTTVNDGALRTGYLWVTFMGMSCVITVRQEAKE